MKILIILILPFIIGVYEGHRQMLTEEINYLTSQEHIWYKRQIERWEVPVVIPSVKTPKDGWENRFRY